MGAKHFARREAAHKEMKALAFREPWATLIATGVKTHEYRKSDVSVPIKDLVVCASSGGRSDPFSGLCYGKAIALVDVTRSIRTADGYTWVLENPRLIKPFDVPDSEGFFYVQDEVEALPNDRKTYEQVIMPYAEGGWFEEIELVMDACFGNREALRFAFWDDIEKWL